MQPSVVFNALAHAAYFGDALEPQPSTTKSADIRRRAGVSRELLALVLGVSTNTLERHESGTTQSSCLDHGPIALRYSRVLAFLVRITETVEREAIACQ